MTPDEIFTKMVDAGNDWADLNAAAEAMEEQLKSVKAQLMVSSVHTTAAGKEMEALADESYREYVRNMTNARKLANRARVKFDSIKAWIELYRSAEASRRAEMTLR
jgi:hypothetical protein